MAQPEFTPYLDALTEAMKLSMEDEKTIFIFKTIKASSYREPCATDPAGQELPLLYIPAPVLLPAGWDNRLGYKADRKPVRRLGWLGGKHR